MQLVSFDALSLLKLQNESRINDDLIENHRKLLVRVRHLSRTAHSRINDFGLASLVKADANTLGNIKLSQPDKSVGYIEESFQALIYEASCSARLMIRNLKDLFYYQVNETVGTPEKSLNVNAVKKSDLVLSYLSWYSDFLDQIVAKNGVSHSEIISFVTDFEFLNDRIEVYIQEQTTNKVLSNIEQSIDNLTSKAKSDSKTFIDQTLAAAASKISENAIAADKSVSEFKELITDFKEVRKKQSEYFSDIEAVHDYCNARKSSIDAIFIAANRQGMANSFSEMARGLIKPMVIWGAMLTLSLFLIAIAGYAIESDVLSGNLGKDNLVAISLRALIISPLIWLAWFSSRQYGHASKLRQDYSYKSAVAMAYQGYKDEATELSDGMHEKLLENIILHFSENPVRLYEKSDASSPLDEILKKISPEKFSEIIKSIKS